MKKLDAKKKTWLRPEVRTLSIKKDTFSGSVPGGEGPRAYGPPRPPVI